MSNTSSFELSPLIVQSPSGLQIKLNANGSLNCVEYKNLWLNLFPGNEMEGGPTNIYLRIHSTKMHIVPLLGPQSPCGFDVEKGRLRARGSWQGLDISICLLLAPETVTWMWNLEIHNRQPQSVCFDLIYAQDVALADPGMVRANEHFVSQYLDFKPLHHPHLGTCLAVRQNLLMHGQHPWMLLGSFHQGVGFCTDAYQFYEFNRPSTFLPRGLNNKNLSSQVLQHEHAMAVLQDSLITLQPNTKTHLGFYSTFIDHHPEASSEDDLVIVDQVMKQYQQIEKIENIFDSSVQSSIERTGSSLFTTAERFSSLDLKDEELKRFWPEPHRLVERENGPILSFFTQNNSHVVLKAKEERVMRPHGTLLRTGNKLFPEEKSLTTTVWMSGIFNSMLTLGNTNMGRVITPNRGYLNFFQSYGQRVFVEINQTHYLLDMPSAFEMKSNSCRWLYKYKEGLIEIKTEASFYSHHLRLSLTVIDGPPVRFLIANSLPEKTDSNALHTGIVQMLAAKESMIEKKGTDDLLFEDGLSRQIPYTTVLTSISSHFAFDIQFQEFKNSHVPSSFFPPSFPIDDESHLPWKSLVGQFRLVANQKNDFSRAIDQLDAVMPWMTHNALIHFLAPRGLEQNSAGAWGTRDVSQGPVELLKTFGQWEAWKDLLVRIFQAQDIDGHWPQWFMFFEEQKNIRSHEYNSDVPLWPLLALAEYILSTEDSDILSLKVSFYDRNESRQNYQGPIWDHVQRALKIVHSSLIPGTALVSYGNGDWDDSMRPIDHDMRYHLCSSWTVQLHYHTLLTLGRALDLVGWERESLELSRMAQDIQKDFHRHLVVDGKTPGFVYFNPNGKNQYFFHPLDEVTNIHFRLISMVHGILSELLTPEQAKQNLLDIQSHLLGLDGVRLFDRPLEYKGGVAKLFERAESSSFFGREIGLMYTHAHLRYAQALAFCGDSDGLFEAITQSHPMGFQELVRGAKRRQLNCYYSSSDASFKDRYESFSQYGRVRNGGVDFEGGWRIYSSGPGLFLRVVHDFFLGIQLYQNNIVFDPVIAKKLDGLTLQTQFLDRDVSICYKVNQQGHGLNKVILNGKEISFSRQHNPYRLGGGKIPLSQLLDSLQSRGNQLEIEVN